MTPERFDEVVAQAVAAVEALDTDLLVLGEIGIGNTTAAAALAGALLGGDAATWVGRGTGVDDAGLERKRAAVAAVMDRTSSIRDPIEIMREAGGAELTAMAAATVAARLRSIPVVLDGYVVTSAVLPLARRRARRARPLHRRSLLGGARAPPGAGSDRQAGAARPGHAARRGQWGDGCRPDRARRLRRGRRGGHVHGVVRAGTE